MVGDSVDVHFSVLIPSGRVMIVPEWANQHRRPANPTHSDHFLQH